MSKKFKTIGIAEKQLKFKSKSGNLITKNSDNMKKYTASNRTKIMLLCVELFLFISFISVLQNFNNGMHYNPRNCQQNEKTRNDFITSRQLSLLHTHNHGHGIHSHGIHSHGIHSHGLHTHGAHNHVTETVVESCGSRDPFSINKYKRDPSYDFPFDRCSSRLNRTHHHTGIIPNTACTTTVRTTNTSCVNNLPYSPITPPCTTQIVNSHAHHIAPPICEPGYPMVQAVIDDTIHSALAHTTMPCSPYTGFMGFRTRYITPMVTTFMGLPIYARGLISLVLLALPIIIAVLFFTLLAG
ncbi:hypothetical protein PCYB_111050 [Plasmodium cynomolgi strain B]|uniref:Uncharacterized protein n=1 Tax=Plasmodium cynomolgi (strain B) TaxID=1120755 RepID=K6UUI7_PLACD|nr:hypothetical protein PCYB_111050 [Plasmodium cynomolgi strain B]GAB67084.1 hypothetical protein PCYB_111050 [Plasmodium cynomolgi strain B]